MAEIKNNVEPRAVVDPIGSTDMIWYKDNMEFSASDKFDAVDASVAALQTGKADTAHTHEGYASADHTHTGYANASHSHSQYTPLATFQEAANAIQSAVNGKADADHTHTDYAAVNHEHTDYADADHSHTEYAAATHTHSEYANADHSHTEYAPTTHGHTDYAPVSHEHSGYANSDHTHTGFAAENHTHDYAATTHDHDDDYSAVGHNHSYNDLTDKPTIPAAYSHPASHPASMITGLAEVATSGSYNDLSDKPTIPSAYTHPSSHPASMIEGLAEVATSGDYDDLTNKPTIPAAYTHPTSHPASMISGLATVATSGSYADLSNKPTIPTVPTSLPANGGNADTVDNKHASDFASANHNHDDDYAEASHTHAQSEISGLETALNGKASTSHTHSNYASTSHTHSAATTSAAGFMSAADKAKLDGIATGANAYSHPTTSGNKHIPSGGSSGQILRWSADGTAVWGADNNTTYSNATTSAAGLMSASDKSKLDGIASGANNYTLPTASSTLGGVKTTSTVTSNSGYTACPIIGGVPYYKDTNSTYSLSSFGVTATAAELNKLDGVTATATELNYVDGVTSNIQTQLNGKASSSHNHNSAYLSLDGGTINGDTNIAGVLRVQGNQAYYYNASSVTQVIGTNNATGGTTICNGPNANMYINGANLMTPNCLPKATNAHYCGNANYRWKGIYSAAAVNVSSDERLKENIEDVNADEAVNLINNIDVKSFNYIGNDEPQIGVMAQDILAKSPELAKALVTEGEDGYYGVKTSDLVFPLIIAVQRLQKEIEELKKNMK